MTRWTSCSLALTSLLACARHAEITPAHTAQATEIRPSACAGAPMTARWTQTTKRPWGTGTRLTLEGVVEVSGVVPGPIVAQLRAPEGSVPAGSTTLSLGPHAQGDLVPIEFVIDYPSTPSKDAFVEIDARDADDIAHVTLAYRFGRPAPGAFMPVANGPHAVFRGLDLGPSVLLSPAIAAPWSDEPRAR